MNSSGRVQYGRASCAWRVHSSGCRRARRASVPDLLPRGVRAACWQRNRWSILTRERRYLAPSCSLMGIEKEWRAKIATIPAEPIGCCGSEARRSRVSRKISDANRSPNHDRGSRSRRTPSTSRFCFAAESRLEASIQTAARIWSVSGRRPRLAHDSASALEACGVRHAVAAPSARRPNQSTSSEINDLLTVTVRHKPHSVTLIQGDLEGGRSSLIGDLVDASCATASFCG